MVTWRMKCKAETAHCIPRTPPTFERLQNNINKSPLSGNSPLFETDTNSAARSSRSLYQERSTTPAFSAVCALFKKNTRGGWTSDFLTFIFNTLHTLRAQRAQGEGPRAILDRSLHAHLKWNFTNESSPPEVEPSQPSGTPLGCAFLWPVFAVQGEI